MFLRRHQRTKDGKPHSYWSLVETVRTPDGPRQRRLCYLGELNESGQARWLKTIEVFNAQGESRQLKLFPSEVEPPEDDPAVARVRLDKVRLERTRRFGDCFLGLELWRRLALDHFSETVLDRPEEPVDVPWSRIAALLAIHRLCAPGSELAIEERWYPTTALDDLLHIEAGKINDTRLYRCLDRLIPHKASFERHLAERYGELFAAQYDVLLYDLTSSYVEGAAEKDPLMQRGYSRDHRPDCKQVVIALIVNVEGFPLSYETFDGNRADVTTLEAVLRMVERKYGKARRVWVFDRGIISEENLEALRRRGGQYLVGTPRAKLKQFEQSLLESHGWEQVRPEVEVKLVPTPQGEETYVLCRSTARREKELAIRSRFSTRLEKGLKALAKRVAEGKLKDRAKVERRLGGPAGAPSAGGRSVCSKDHAACRPAPGGLESAAGAASLATGARGRLPVAHQFAGRRARTTLEELYPAHGSGGGLSCAQERAFHSPHLSPTGAPRQGSHPGRLPGLRPVGHLEAPADQEVLDLIPGEDPPPAVDAAQRGHHPPHHRWP
jgi:hypothetical protein